MPSKLGLLPGVRVKPAKNHSVKVLTESATCLFVLVDLATARSDMKAEETLCRYQIGRVHPFAETVLPSAGLIRDQEPLLERVILHF